MRLNVIKSNIRITAIVIFLSMNIVSGGCKSFFNSVETKYKPMPKNTVPTNVVSSTPPPKRILEKSYSNIIIPDRTKLTANRAIELIDEALDGLDIDLLNEAGQVLKYLDPTKLHAEDAAILSGMGSKIGLLLNDDSILEHSINIYSAANPVLNNIVYSEESTFLRLAAYRLGKNPKKYTTATIVTKRLGLESEKVTIPSEILFTTRIDGREIDLEIEHRVQNILINFFAANWIMTGISDTSDIQNLARDLKLQGIYLIPFLTAKNAISGETLALQIIEMLNK